MDVVSIIPARSGSKGLPGKNINEFAGKPMIAWTIEASRNAACVARTIVSTDGTEIADVAREHGAEVPFMRPSELAEDHFSTDDVMIHAIEWLRDDMGRLPEYVCLLQPTSPLGSAEDIDAALAIMRDNDADAVVSVFESPNHPYLAKAVTETGYLKWFVEVEAKYRRRQNFSECYCLNGAIYVLRTELFVRDRSFQPQKTLPYVMPPQRSMDIDDRWNFQLAELVQRGANKSSTDE